MSLSVVTICCAKGALSPSQEVSLQNSLGERAAGKLCDMQIFNKEALSSTAVG